MKITMLCRAICLALAFMAILLPTSFSQGSEAPESANLADEPTEPLNDFTERHVISEKKVLKYAPVREADIMWETRIWRVIDTREKMNLPFVAPESPLFNVLKEAILQGQITAYSTESDKFDIPIPVDDVRKILYKTDTVSIINMETGEEETQVVSNDLNWEDVKRFRIKEAWFFDKNLGALRHRILGIAPMIDEKDEDGNFIFERPLFWVHYPSTRSVLAGHKAVASDNVAANTTWEDLFEQRHFASYIYKESNVQDRRLSEYLAGVDLLMESKRIQDELFDKEHDLWSW